MGMAPTALMGPLANVSTSNLDYNISNYLCTNFGAFIKKCTTLPKMAAYPLYYTDTPKHTHLQTHPNTSTATSKHIRTDTHTRSHTPADTTVGNIHLILERLEHPTGRAPVSLFLLCFQYYLYRAA